MSLTELSAKLTAICPPRPARERTCDECGHTGLDVEVESDPCGPCRDTGHLSERFLCDNCRAGE